MRKAVVGITGTGSLIGQAIIKSLKRSSLAESVRIVGFDYFNNTVGSYWCDKNYLLPDILKKNDIDEWTAQLKTAIKSEKIELLFIGVDFELPILAKLRAEIETDTGAKVLVSSKEAIEIANDKFLTYTFLKENGLYYPKTYLPEDLVMDKIEFPCIVKPRVGARSRDVYKVSSEKELIEKIKIVNQPIIQELLGSDGEEYTCGVLYFDNEPKEIIALKRSLKDGNTFTSIFCKSFPGIIYEYLTDVSNALKPYGACNFQLRIDKNGLPKIFEINARHSGTTYIRSMFGYNEVEYIVQRICFGKNISFDLKEGKVIRYFDEFFINGNQEL